MRDRIIALESRSSQKLPSTNVHGPMAPGLSMQPPHLGTGLLHRTGDHQDGRDRIKPTEVQLLQLSDDDFMKRIFGEERFNASPVQASPKQSLPVTHHEGEPCCCNIPSTTKGSEKVCLGIFLGWV